MRIHTFLAHTWVTTLTNLDHLNSNRLWTRCVACGRRTSVLAPNDPWDRPPPGRLVCDEACSAQFARKLQPTVIICEPTSTAANVALSGLGNDTSAAIPANPLWERNEATSAECPALSQLRFQKAPAIESSVCAHALRRRRLSVYNKHVHATSPSSKVVTSAHALHRSCLVPDHEPSHLHEQMPVMASAGLECATASRHSPRIRKRVRTRLASPTASNVQVSAVFVNIHTCTYIYASRLTYIHEQYVHVHVQLYSHSRGYVFGQNAIYL